MKKMSLSSKFIFGISPLLAIAAYLIIGSFFYSIIIFIVSIFLGVVINYFPAIFRYILLYSVILFPAGYFSMLQIDKQLLQKYYIESGYNYALYEAHRLAQGEVLPMPNLKGWLISFAFGAIIGLIIYLVKNSISTKKDNTA
ncbi:hypothetical protein KW782_04180 [Candidatus Parcubacteria bacterium]|nr:hypothetical protein [Candidatus Parcubacteria bacterium]